MVGELLADLFVGPLHVEETVDGIYSGGQVLSAWRADVLFLQCGDVAVILLVREFAITARGERPWFLGRTMRNDCVDVRRELLAIAGFEIVGSALFEACKIHQWMLT